MISRNSSSVRSNDGDGSVGVTVHRPENRLDASALDALRGLIAEVRLYRYHVVVAFLRDFRAGYTGTGLGVFWNILLPLMPIGVYALLATLRIVPAFDETAAPVAISFNATLWFFFVGCVQMPISVARSRNSEALKTAVPLIVPIVAGFGQLMFEGLVRLILVVALALILRESPVWSSALCLLSVVSGVMLFFGLGLTLAILNIAAPDVQKVTGPILGYGIFLSGVIFPLPESGSLAILHDLNPFAAVITGSRLLAFAGVESVAHAFWVWTLMGPLLLLIGARVFFIMERRIRGVV